MKTNIIANNTVINTVMKAYMKYICAVLLLIGTSVSAWGLTGVNCTYNVWDAPRNKWQPFVVQDQALVVPPAPEMPNYIFVGWHIYDGSTTEWPVNGSGNYMWDDGKGTPDVYYVHPIPNRADNADNKHTAKQGYTNMYAVYRPSSGSNPVAGWLSNSGWTAPSETQITITFKPNGGSPNADQTQQILSNTPTHLSSCPFTYSSHEFAGWGTNSSIGTLTYADCQQVTFNSNQTLYAEWMDADKWSVQYKLTGMTKVTGPSEVANETEIEATFAFSNGYAAPVTYKVEMQDYYFEYADITDDADYDNGYLLVIPEGGITGNVIITITATEKNKYTVSYLANGATSGSAPSSQANQNKNSDVTVRANTGSLAKTGYTFAGWNTRADGNGTTYAAGSGVISSIQHDVILYAKWDINQYNVAVADADNVTITATPASESAIAEGSNRDVVYGKEVTLNYVDLLGGHSFREWKITKTDETDVTMALLADKTANNAVFTVPDYGVIVSCKLTGDYIAWCPEPAIELSGDIAISAYYNRGVMAVVPLHVEAVNLDNTAIVSLSSNSSDVYFSADRNANFLKEAPNLPTTTLDLTASDGAIDADVYVHYKPGSAGDGSASTVTITATWDTPEPDLTDALDINVRSLPEKFVIATKVGGSWYALPSNIATATTPDAVAIEVNESNYTAIAPNTCTYTMWPVLTHETAANDRYALYEGKSYGERVRPAAANGERKGLWANNSKSTNTINNANSITGLKSTGGAANEWKIGTTVGATGNEWKYTLQTNQPNNQNYLNLYRTMQWGTYSSGLTDGVYFLPVTEVEPFEMKVVEWYPTKVLVYTTSTLTSLSPTVKIDGDEVASPTFTSKGGNLYEIGNLALEINPTKTLSVGYTVSTTDYACTKNIPVIISRGEKSISDAPFSTLTKEVYNHADLVVRDGAVLTVNGTQAENEFYDVTIYPTSKISVPAQNTNDDANKLSVHSLTFFGGIDQIYNGSSYAVNKYGVPELSLKGTLAKKTISTIDYIMRVDLDQMYQMCVPYNVEMADITYWDGTTMTPGTDLYISAYDGQARADRANKTWAWEEDFEEKFGTSTLRQGIGYTISAEPQEGYGDGYSIIRMPMKSNITAGSSEAAKAVAVTAFANSHGQTITDNHKGWNYLGNPYMVSISGNTAGGASSSQIVVGYLRETGTGPWEWVNDDIRYVSIPHDDGTDYEQRKWSESTLTLKPFKSFFVQIANSGELSFALESRNNASSRFLQVIEREMEFEILLKNETNQDHMGLLIADKYSPAYEINADLEKLENTMSVYTLTGGYKLAYNALSPDDAKDTIPIGYIANKAGSYTFSLDENSYVGDVKHIWLTDYELYRSVDLKEDSYNFTTLKGRNETRFALTIVLLEEEQIPTDIESILPENQKDVPIKFIYQDNVYILFNSVIYDATGKKVREINK